LRTFDLGEQVDRLTRSGYPRLQRMTEETYRKLWPTKVELPEKYEGRFDRALVVDAFPSYPIWHPAEREGRTFQFPVRLLPLPRNGSPIWCTFDEDTPLDLLEPPLHPDRGYLLRYVVFWQAGERRTGASPNALRGRLPPDERCLGFCEGLMLPLQEEMLVRTRSLMLGAAARDDAVHVIRWPKRKETPVVMEVPGAFMPEHGLPTCGTEVVPVSTEHADLFLTE
jgi:hypothetical protein